MSFSDAELERYARHIVLREVGGVGQARLKAARVLVIGAGGLGCPVILYLAAAGVGTLGIVDFDAVSLSNLQRQIAFATADVGGSKAEAAGETARSLNPEISVAVHPVRIAQDSARTLIQHYDVVADCSDNFDTRLLINDACYHERKILVSAAVSEFTGQLAVFKAFDNTQSWPCYRCLMPQAPPPGTVPSCSEAGILGAAAGVMGTLQALEVIKEIVGFGETLAGHLLIYDALATNFRKLRLPRDPACALCRTEAYFSRNN